MNPKERTEEELVKRERKRKRLQDILEITKADKDYFRNRLIGGYVFAAVILFCPVIIACIKQYFKGIPFDPNTYTSLVVTFGFESAAYLFSVNYLKGIYYDSYQVSLDMIKVEEDMLKECEEEIKAIKEEIQGLVTLEKFMKQEKSEKEITRYTKGQLLIVKKYYQSIFVPLFNAGLYTDNVFDIIASYTEEQLSVVEMILSLKEIPDKMLFNNYIQEEPFSLLTEECPKELTEQEMKLYCYRQCKLFIEKMKTVKVPEEIHILRK